MAGRSVGRSVGRAGGLEANKVTSMVLDCIRISIFAFSQEFNKYRKFMKTSTFCIRIGKNIHPKIGSVFGLMCTKYLTQLDALCCVFPSYVMISIWWSPIVTFSGSVLNCAISLHTHTKIFRCKAMILLHTTSLIHCECFGRWRKTIV